MHTRRVECRGFRRDDGLWDIEGRITDTKAYAFDNRFRGRLEPGTPIHDMWIRLTLDDTMMVRAIDAVTDAAPYRTCPEITPAFQKLVGLRIGPGWRQRVHAQVGGVAGCTHLVELLGPLATAAFQTIRNVVSRETAARNPEAPRPRPAILDTCHALATDGEVVREQYPEFYTGPAAG